MTDALQEALTGYGPLGILALVGLLAAWYMFRLLTRERKAQREEMSTMMERFITHAEKSNEKYHTLADRLTAVVESIRQNMRPGG